MGGGQSVGGMKKWRRIAIRRYGCFVWRLSAESR
jgi:hypothetical protein